MVSTGKDPRPDETALTAAWWVLRGGAAACFIGHGMLGVSRTAAWTAYFAVAGIGRDTALGLMPLVGLFDIVLGILVLLRPTRPLAAYLALWCVWTALLRPLAGESAWETIERAGNYGAPLALLFLFPGAAGTGWLGRRWCPDGAAARPGALDWNLRLTTVLVLAGHGALGMVVQKPLFRLQYSHLGLPGLPTEVLVGAFECLLALAVLVKPDRRLLFGVVAWKLATEALNPIAGSPVWVFLEHGGSYAAPLALALLRSKPWPALTCGPSRLPAT